MCPGTIDCDTANAITFVVRLSVYTKRNELMMMMMLLLLKLLLLAGSGVPACCRSCYCQ